MRHELLMTVIALSLALSGCSSKGDEGGAGKAGGETKAAVAGGAAAEVAKAPFALTLHKVETKDSVAPNKTYEEQGLGAKAGEGKTFLCVQYEAKNVGEEPTFLPSPKLVGKDGAEVEVSLEAAGKYLPEDWKDRKSGKLAPGDVSQESPCFVVGKDAVTGDHKLVLSKDSWGKNPGWKAELPLS